MANDEQLKKLKEEGSDAWNEWRRQNPDIRIDLVSADLKGMSLVMTNLEGAQLAGADFEGSELIAANLKDAVLVAANLKRAMLYETRFQGADLRKADLRGAIFNFSNLEDADLRSVKGLVLDSTMIRDTRFSPRATDPWSVLRRAYTGPKFTFQLLALIVFALPYLGKTVFWSFVNRGQAYTQGILEAIKQRAVQQKLDDQTIASLGLSTDEIISLSRCLNDVCEQWSALQLLLGSDQQGLLWLLPLILIFYNALRGGLTYFIAPLRDEEERSGYSPAWSGVSQMQHEPKPYQREWWQGYRVLYYVHRVVSVLGLIALAAFVFNAWHWLGQPIYLPA